MGNNILTPSLGSMIKYVISFSYHITMLLTGIFLGTELNDKMIRHSGLFFVGTLQVDRYCLKLPYPLPVQRLYAAHVVSFL